MQITFREPTIDDIAPCVNIIKEIYQEKKWEEILPKDISDVLNKVYPSKFLVVSINDTIVGFGCYIKLPPEFPSPNITYKLTWINIIPKEQGKGIGKKIVYELQKHIKSECKENFFVILETDKPSFYKKIGYETYSKNGDNDFMQKFFPKIIFPKILIGTLFSEVKDYAIRDWFKNVCNFTYPKFDLCMVDNSKDKKYHKKMFNYFSDRKKKSNMNKLTILHAPRIDKKSEIFMAFSANELRKYFLKNDYDFLLNLESDILPPLDVMERLLSYNKQIIGMTYFSGDKSTSWPMIIDLNIINNAIVPCGTPYIKGFYDMTDTFEPKLSFGQGLGCVLMNREIVQKIPFQADTIPNGAHYDTIFYRDLLHNNIGNYFVPIICRHENQIWSKQNKMIGQ